MNTNNSPQKILIIKLRKLGDVLLTTPLVRQTRAIYPNAQITFLSEPLGSQVFLNSSKVDRVWQFKRNLSAIEYIKFCFKVYKEHFDLVIDLYGHNKTALISLFSRAEIRIGYAKENKKSISYNYPYYIPDNVKHKKYNALHGLIMTKQLGTNENDLELEYHVSQEDHDYAIQFIASNLKSNTIAFCAQSERDGAQVPTDLLIKIGKYLIENGYFLYFVYGPGEKKLASKVYNEINQPDQCLFDYDVPSIAQVKAIFEHCIMYIGNDGGNKHLAVSANIPTIGLFYGDEPSAWTPTDAYKHRFIQTKNNEDALFQLIDLFQGWSLTESKFKTD